MSDLLQPGRHPDADQLSAFAEQALPAHEREATLAHLAVCAECRAVVALSLHAAEELSKPAKKPARRSWFHGWNLAWPAAAAVAALTLVLVYVHHATVTRSGSGEHMEIAVAPPAPQLPQKKASGGTPRNLQPPLAGHAPQATQRNAEVLNEMQPTPGGAPSAARKQPAAGGGGASTSITDKDLLDQPRTMADGRGLKAPPIAAKERPNALAPPAAPVNEFVASARNEQVQQGTAAHGSAFAANEVASSATLQASSPVHPLPSGLPVLSMVEHGRQMLAIDTAHTLFLSEDAGAHWRAIEVPWKAHAVTVSLVSASGRTAVQHPSGTGAEFGGRTVTGRNLAKLRAAGGTASVTGMVTDVTGAAIADASVVVTTAANQTSHTVYTDRSGHYIVAGLAPGTYKVEASARGFRTARVTAVTILPSHRNVTNLKLSVSSATQTVTVTGGETAGEIPLQKQAQTAASVAAAAPPVFEITTEDGARWISADGVTWKHE